MPYSSSSLELFSNKSPILKRGNAEMILGVVMLVAVLEHPRNQITWSMIRITSQLECSIAYGTDNAEKHGLLGVYSWLVPYRQYRRKCRSKSA